MFSKSIHYIGLNFVSQERLDPILYSFLSLLGLAQNQLIYVAAQLCVLAAGVALLLTVTRSSGSLIVGLWVAVSLVLLLGLEPFYLKYQWFPWMLSGLILLLVRSNFRTMLVAAIFLGLWVFSSGAMAPLGILIAALAAIVISLKMRSFTLVIAEGSRSYTSFSLAVAVALLVAVWAIPEYPMPKYPADAKLVVDSVFHSLPHPLIGNRLQPIPVIGPVYFGLLALYAQNYLLLLVSVGVALGVSAVLWKESVVIAVKLLVWHGAVCSVALFSLLFWPESKIGLHPFFLLMRVVPGVGFVFLPWLLLPYSVLFLAIGVYAYCSRRVICLAIMSCLVLAGVLRVTGNAPLAQAHFAEFGAESDLSPYVGVTWSPSATVVSTMGAWVATPGVAKARDWANLKRLKMGVDYSIESVEAAPNLAAARRAVDGNVFTSWGTGRVQAPGDYFLIRFADVVRVVRVALSIQETPKSYPCSINVWSVDENGVEREVYSHDPWPGPVFWTQEGFPYFGSKQHVVIDFANRQLTKSLRFEVASSDCGGRGWSIGELKMYDLRGDS